MYVSKKHVKSAWISRAKPICKNNKPWGFEYSWAGFDGIHGKTLFIKKGHRTSFKFHMLKSEVLFLRTGKAEVLFGDELSLEDPVGHPMTIVNLNPGDSLMVQSGCPYRIKAIEDCEINEIGNNLSDKPVRLEDDYGRYCDAIKNRKNNNEK